jgi:hypothetical protein
VIELTDAGTAVVAVTRDRELAARFDGQVHRHDGRALDVP